MAKRQHQSCNLGVCKNASKAVQPPQGKEDTRCCRPGLRIGEDDVLIYRPQKCNSKAAGHHGLSVSRVTTCFMHDNNPKGCSVVFLGWTDGDMDRLHDSFRYGLLLWVSSSPAFSNISGDLMNDFSD